MKVLLFPVRSLVLFFKLSGVKGAVLFGLGVAVGLLLAPQTGAEMRVRLRSRVSDARGRDIPADEDLTL